MVNEIKSQKMRYIFIYSFFALLSLVIMVYYLSNTIIHYTSNQQFPINSFSRFPLTIIIFSAELFSFVFSLYFVYNLINGNKKTNKPSVNISASIKNSEVAILVPVYNEPMEIVTRTINACKKVKWAGGVNVYILDDSTNDEDKKNMQSIGKKFGAKVITRESREGFKAGNINYALKHHIKEKYFAILDSDQAPEEKFLEETMNHFQDLEVAFVQTPQYFINGNSLIERAQKLGSNVFYQTQCVSKAKDKAMPFCGTNVVVKTEAFKSVNGFSYYTSTEDIELGLRLNEAGYHGAYVPKVLVKGYATEDFTAYASQQYRWANGNLAILRQSWLNIMFGKFSLRQQIHTLFTTGWWLIGLASILYILVPILSFFLGGTHHTWLPSWMLALLFCNVAIGIMMIYFSLSNRNDEDKISISDAFLQYSLLTNSMFIYAKAAINAFFKKYIGFVRTNKNKQKTGLSDIKFNLMLSAVCFGFSIFALFKASTFASIEQLRMYLPISIWMLFYSIILASSIVFVGHANAVVDKSAISSKDLAIESSQSSKSIRSKKSLSTQNEIDDEFDIAKNPKKKEWNIFRRVI